MKSNPKEYLAIRETLLDYFIAPTEIVVDYTPRGPPHGPYYSITIGRADGEGDHQTIDLTPEQFNEIRRYNL